ncbi:MAG TPA: ABC transporter permease subunit [Anaerolineae bacterium]|nr:ABC transporter permease subunit [Anaerolineae bacterium]
MRNILIFAELTFREARRRKILWVALALGLTFIALYALGFYQIFVDFLRHGQGRNMLLDSGFNFLVMAGFYVISFLGVMLAVLTSVGTLPGEVSSHTIQALAARPVRRRAILLGKWLGLALMLVSYIALLAAGVIVATWGISGYIPPNVVAGVALIALQALIMLSVCMLGGTRLSTIANGVVAFMLYGIAFVGGWIETIGSFAHNETAVDIGILSSLLVPSEAMWKMASYGMQPPAVRGLGISPFSLTTAPSTAMLIYALLYTAALLVLAVRSFNRRDL